MENIFEEFEKEFKCDKERLDKIEFYNTILPYFTRDFFERVANCRFCFFKGFIEYNDFQILEDLIEEIKTLLKKKLEARIKWHGDRLDEHLKGATAALILCNGYNDLFTSMEFSVK